MSDDMKMKFAVARKDLEDLLGLYKSLYSIEPTDHELSTRCETIQGQLDLLKSIQEDKLFDEVRYWWTCYHEDKLLTLYA